MSPRFASYGVMPPKTKEAVCDCCLKPFDRLWMYPHRRFEMLFLDQRQDYLAGWWAMCVFCSALFDRRAYDPRAYYELAARVVTLAIPAELRAAANAEGAESMFELLYRTLGEDALLGEGILWQEGEDRGPKRFPCPPPGI